MASTSARVSKFSTGKTAPAPNTMSLHSHTGSRDMARIALFLLIPIYARTNLCSSILIALKHVGAIACIGVYNTYFSRGIVSLDLVWDIIYGLLISSFPSWSTSILRIIQVGSKIEGWRWELVYWTFVARRLIYLLPEYYGSDVEALIEEYEYAYPYFRSYVSIISGAIVYYALWPKGYPWPDAVLMLGIISSFIKCGYLAYLNYAHLQKSGMTVRQDSWPYRGMHSGMLSIPYNRRYKT